MRERATILRRFYHAYRRRIQFAQEDRKLAEDVAKREAEEIRLEELAKENGTKIVKKDETSNHGKEVEEEEKTTFPLSQPEGFFVASSIEMSLVLARSMAMSGSPMVINSICHTLLNLMEKSDGAILIIGSHQPIDLSINMVAFFTTHFNMMANLYYY